MIRQVYSGVEEHPKKRFVYDYLKRQNGLNEVYHIKKKKKKKEKKNLIFCFFPAPLCYKLIFMLYIKYYYKNIDNI
eukprot:SAG11_NODE_12489_length_700_cov_7.933444_2_plen_76_part_00